MSSCDSVINLVEMSAYEGNAAATGLAALCAILVKKGVLSSREVDEVIKGMEFALKVDGEGNASRSQAAINVRQKFRWF